MVAAGARATDTRMFHGRAGDLSGPSRPKPAPERMAHTERPGLIVQACEPDHPG